MEKDFRITATIRNNRLLKEREALGFSQKKMAKFCGVPFQVYTDMERLVFNPIDRNGDLKDHAVSVCNMLEKDSSYLWSEGIKKVTQNKVERKADFSELLLISSENPQEKLEGYELKEKLYNLLKTLTKREQAVIELRYGLNGKKEHTLEEAGKGFGLNGQDISKDRIRVIQNEAIRKLRHPSRSEKIKEYTTD